MNNIYKGGKEMLAVKFVGNGCVEVVDVPKPKAAKGWVIVKVMASALWGLM